MKLREILTRSRWSLRDFQPSATSKTIMNSTSLKCDIDLHRLCRLSGLKVPDNQVDADCLRAEIMAMQSFVQSIQKVETGNVEPLRNLLFDQHLHSDEFVVSPGSTSSQQQSSVEGGEDAGRELLKCASSSYGGAYYTVSNK